MALLTLRDVSLSFGGPKLLDRVNLQIERGDRLCLLGRNGEGKSSLLKLLVGEIAPDDGQVIRQQGLRVSRLPQEVPSGASAPSPMRWLKVWPNPITLRPPTTIVSMR